MKPENKPKSVLVLGSGALQIGQAGEFDYSGSQALKALKQEGIRTILVNPNIATVQTESSRADQTYLLPVTTEWVSRVIEKEKPNAILLGFGGQTALNCGLALHDQGVLKKHKVRVLGTPVETIRKTEDRELFKRELQKMRVQTPKSIVCKTVPKAVWAAKKIGFPVMVRAGFSLGGLGSGKASNEKQLKKICQKALAVAPHVLIEEFLGGWKEIEYEVVRDSLGNCLTVCNMENFDPLGIHTGESIVVAPSQTLTDAEYHFLRELSIRVISGLGIVGECNIQFALHPKSTQYRVIEVNARLSRSSALASKATGYPLAYVAAQLALGKSLLELRNNVTKKTSAFFEPALDYCVVKIPRWDLQKFVGVGKKIGSEMKSVGEVMAIGRNFEEAVQKAIRMLQIGMYGVVGNKIEIEKLADALQNPTDQRLFAVVQALKKKYSIKRIAQLTKIDSWFLHKIRHILEIEQKILLAKKLSRELLLEAKQHGFSDKQIAVLLGHQNENKIRKLRHEYSLRPFARQIDTLAAEFPAKTNYLYLTYNASQNDVLPSNKKTVLVLGSGPYSIGSSVEFDWCTVNTVKALQKNRQAAIVLNCNPETVSTDFDESDRLYFDELSLETVLEIHSFEKPVGTVVSVGGQIANNLALRLAQNKVRLLGTSAASIDTAENRHKFSRLCDKLKIDQPLWKEMQSEKQAVLFAKKTGFPVLIRPSYVLSGSAMAVAHSIKQLKNFLRSAAVVSPEYPVVITRFVLNAKELEIDAVASQGKIVCYALSEHIENAGVHSGDATLVLPPQKTYTQTKQRALEIARRLAKALRITGPFNVQLLAKENRLQVIECNLRASRSFPFVSKTLNHNFIEHAVHAMLKPSQTKPANITLPDFVGVKAPFFSFSRLAGADPVLGVEMASTGEVGCLGTHFEDAFLKAMQARGFQIPVRRLLVHAADALDWARLQSKLQGLAGQTLIQTPAGNKNWLKQEQLEFQLVSKSESKKFDWFYWLSKNPVDLAIVLGSRNPKNQTKTEFALRRACTDHHTPLITDLQLAKRFLHSLNQQNKKPETKSLQEYHHKPSAKPASKTHDSHSHKSRFFTKRPKTEGGSVINFADSLH